MAIQLNPDQKQIIGQAIEAGLIHDTEDVVQAGVDAIRRALAIIESAPASTYTVDWPRELHAWIHGHEAVAPLLSEEAISREYIYGMRGL